MMDKLDTIGEGTKQMARRAVLLLSAVVVALVFSSGVAMAITKNCQTNVDCFGTRESDTLKGSIGNDFIYGRGGADTLKGFEFSDFLYGQIGPDKLFGGPDPDTLIGGPGNDSLNGGENLDYYHFGSGWGKDSITDSATSSDVVILASSPGQEVPVADDLTINLISGEGPEVKTGSTTSTINWEGNAIEHVISGTGDDQITGNSGKNHIYGTSGADDISAGGGNDEIRVRDGSGDDIVDCGEAFIGSDNDTVFFDDGDQIDPNCEHEIPAP